MQPLPTAKRIAKEDVFGKGLDWIKVRRNRARKLAQMRSEIYGFPGKGFRGEPYRNHPKEWA
jgi:hypothetical protein